MLNHHVQCFPALRGSCDRPLPRVYVFQARLLAAWRSHGNLCFVPSPSDNIFTVQQVDKTETGEWYHGTYPCNDHYLQPWVDIRYKLIFQTMLMMFTNFRKFLLMYSIKAPFLILKSSFPLLMNSVKIACFFALLLLDPCT